MRTTIRWLLVMSIATSSALWAASPKEMLNGYAKAAGVKGLPDKGQVFFNSTRGKEWSCSSCHTKQPTGEGLHASTHKPISPLAPAANNKRFTDAAKTEKWFRRNCNDVLNRECSNAEKADVLSWLITLKP